MMPSIYSNWRKFPYPSLFVSADPHVANLFFKISPVFLLAVRPKSQGERPRIRNKG